MPNPSYSGTVDFAENYVKQFGVEVSWVKGGCPVEDYRKAIKANTKVKHMYKKIRDRLFKSNFRLNSRLNFKTNLQICTQTEINCITVFKISTNFGDVLLSFKELHWLMSVSKILRQKI